MSRLFRILLIASLLVGLAPALPAAAQPDLPPNCSLIPVPNSIEIYLICLPQPPVTPAWNGDLVVFAHGYVPPNETSMIRYIEQMLLPDGSFLPSLANSLGYAFASTSYSKNGLAVKEGLADTVRLIQTFKQQYPGVRNVFLIGASEGGLITTLAAEKGAPISGGLALCGPIGDFRGQLNYWGDFRVLFDYFYPGAIPGSPIAIPDTVIQNWESTYALQVAGLIGNPSNQHATEQLLKIARAPIDPADPGTAISTTVGILSYNVLATNEGRQELGGQPFDNRLKWYTGSDNDRKLNGPGGVQRFTARLPLSALLDINSNYQTSGKLKVPLITMHTAGDPIVPYWHETLYNAKTLLGGTPLKHLNIPIARYGHCSFKASEALAAFAILVYRVTGQVPANASTVLPTSKLQQDFADLVRQYQPELPVNPR
jgi:pimeloyl-ACP methyl ester carboxylesterase